MEFKNEIKALRRGFEKSGQTVTVFFGGKRYIVKAVVERYAKDFKRRYGGDEVVGKLGVHGEPDALMFFAPTGSLLHDWDSADDVLVTVGGKSYIVLADSVVPFGDEPAYVIAVLRKTTTEPGDFYD